MLGRRPFLASFLTIFAAKEAQAMGAAYLFLKEELAGYSGVEVTLSIPLGATHYEAEVLSGAGSGASCPDGFAGGGGGGSGGRSRNQLRPIVKPLTAYAGCGGPPAPAGVFDGNFGEHSYLKEGGVIVLMATGGQGGRTTESVDFDSGGCAEGGAGGNNNYQATPVGNEIIPGQSGHPWFAIRNVRIAGRGGDCDFRSGGGKNTTSAGPGHGPNGGPLVFGGVGPQQGAAGLNGYYRIRWYTATTV